MYFLLIQLLGVFAWFVDIISYWFKNKKQLLMFQILADLLFAFHYYLLGAQIGFIICFICSIREFIFSYITSKKMSFILCLLFIYIFFLIGFFTADSPIDLLPILAEVTYCYVLLESEVDIVLGGIIDSIYWIIYGIICKSYAGVISDFIVIISNYLILLKREIRVLKNYSD